MRVGMEESSVRGVQLRRCWALLAEGFLAPASAEGVLRGAPLGYEIHFFHQYF